MAKEVILLEDVPGLGDQGEIVRVSDGYARNFLLPRKLAAPVTDATRRLVEKKRKEVEDQGKRPDVYRAAFRGEPAPACAPLSTPHPPHGPPALRRSLRGSPPAFSCCRE